jgi:orotidine-5'-phosphate decarboxylase
MAELIVALDVPSPEAVQPVIDALGDSVDFYKIGLELYCAGGPDIVRAVAVQGKRIFLDLKLHDIPRTVERAVTAGARLGVELMTLHASGGRAMITAAAQAARACPVGHRPKILAVTVLTSLEQTDLAELGVPRALSDQVAALATLALEAGADGIVCSPQEVGRLRALLPAHALLVTPGVRPAGTAVGDQKRVATPAAAVRSGATHLVVGRPILEAPDPAAAARAILLEMRG